MSLALGLALLLLAGVPLTMVLVNLTQLRAPASSRARAGGVPAISVLIPARDEERSIGAAIDSVLANRDVELELIVLDDHSGDRTAERVRRRAAADGRVRLVRAPALPPGWCGKQHACHVLAGLARHEILVFLDADVRLAPDALARMAAFLDRSQADLISGIPRQETGTWLEKLVIPLIHFVLLGFLPIPAMRRSPGPAFAAGCGQLFMARREAYRRAGGHAAIRASRHDGIKLPRAFREAGASTDLFDATPLASCRMYRGAAELWRGFVKNADEGMASAKAIVPWTLLLFGGQVLPWLLLPFGPAAGRLTGPWALVAAAAVSGWSARLLLTWRFRQSWFGALLHPLGVALVLAIQFDALRRGWSGREVAWKGRVQVDS